MPTRFTIFSLTAAISLLLGVVISVLWIRSHWVGDELRWVKLGEQREVGSASGVLYLDASGGWSRDPRDDQKPTWRVYSGRVVSVSSDAWDGVKLFGFARVRDTVAGKPNSSPTYHWLVGVPYWFLWCASFALPTWWIVLYREMVVRFFRPPPGVCKSCGYDLRATPHRCPECGRATSASSGDRTAG